ncbi:MAG: glycosyltransferase family 2 protein [Lachnospiraceae bacterium]|jgi:glycosyltransferase involved in cell wall biosynthesis|nr:glycosyltransferase family 2 protein [Lachnospiraceae bacterium]
MHTNYTPKDHTFAICAYKESPYLRSCIESLKSQSVRTRIIMATSTPNASIQSLAKEYQIPLYVSPGPSGIAQDWNFAYHCAQTKLVTLAHQDDTYHPAYTAHMLAALNRAGHPLIFFTDYHELRNGQEVSSNRLLRIKRLMLLPLRPRAFRKSRFVRRRILSMGNPISCPSVTYVKGSLPDPLFIPGFKSNIDWQAWEIISRQEGEFTYDPSPLTCHRIHIGSETSAAINNGNIRAKEDYEMFLKFWPRWAARVLMRFYIKGEESNQVG